MTHQGSDAGREPFLALPVAEQRRRIAADILAAIEAGNMEGSVSCQMWQPKWCDNTVANLQAPPDEAVSFPCFVCGIGAPMVAAGRLADRMGEYMSSISYYETGTFQYLYRWFAPNQLRMIEAAYEYVNCSDGRIDHARNVWRGGGAGGHASLSVGIPWHDAEEALRSFSARHAYGTPRLKAIWRRVLESETGEFTLPEVA